MHALVWACLYKVYCHRPPGGGIGLLYNSSVYQRTVYPPLLTCSSCCVCVCGGGGGGEEGVIFIISLLKPVKSHAG